MQHTFPDTGNSAPNEAAAKTPPARLLIPVVLLLLNAAALLLLALPLLVLIWRTIPTGAFFQSLADPLVTKALALSMTTTFFTLGLAVALGTPLAYALARREFPGKRIIETAIDLPMVLPPAVAGLALLMTFGRRGALGPLLQTAGIELAFTTTAVVMAQTFVAAPFFIRAARAGFAGVDPTLERVAATLGVSEWAIFRRVTAPLALPALLGGAIMTWARALGEFGATIMFAGNFSGRTQTMPLAIYSALESDVNAALTLAVLLILVSFLALLVLGAAVGRRGRNPLGL